MARALGQPSWPASTALGSSPLSVLTRPHLLLSPLELLPHRWLSWGSSTSPIPAETPGCRCTVLCGADSRDSELLSILVLRVVEDSGPGVEGKEKGSCGRHDTGQVWFKGQNQEPLPQTEVGRGPSPFLFFAYSNLFAFLVFCWFGLLLWPGFV